MVTLREFMAREGALCHDFTVSVSTLENPRRALLGGDQEFIETLLSDIQAMTYRSFGTALDEESNDGVREHVIGADILAILHEKDQVLGFASAKNISYGGERVFYLHGMVVDPGYSNNGGALILVKTLSSLCNSSKIAFTTQNPIMFCLMNSLCNKTYPSPLYRKVPNDHWRLGKELVAGRTGKFDPETFVIEGLYDKCLYNSIPSSTSPRVNEWFNSSLRIKNGLTSNGFLLIGEMAPA